MGKHPDFTAKLRDVEGEPVIFLDWDVPDPKTGDRPGREGTEEAVKVLRGRCRVVDYFLVPGVSQNPEGRKWNPNDLLKAGHQDIILRMVEEAKPPDWVSEDNYPKILKPVDSTGLEI